MDQKSTHILSTSSSLLGFSFLLLTSIKAFGITQTGYMDKVTAFCILAFALSCFFSFLSIRSRTEESTNRFEHIADYIFFSGLTVLTATSVLIAFDIIRFSK